MSQRFEWYAVLDLVCAANVERKRERVASQFRRVARMVKSVSLRMTFSNYVGHVRLACELVQGDTSVFDQREVKRVEIAVRKRCQFVARE